jgi:hypothetical protein
MGLPQSYVRTAVLNMPKCRTRQITDSFQDYELDVSGGIEFSTEFFGGRDRDRTCDLVVANDALSQLSYTPTSSNQILANAAVLANPRSARP